MFLRTVLAKTLPLTPVFCSTRLPGRLEAIGVTPEQLHRIMVDNPRRALTGEGTCTIIQDRA